MLKMVRILGMSSCLFLILMISVSCRPFAQAFCEIEIQEECGKKECNCRNSYSLRSLYESVLTLSFDTTVCDKCPVFCTRKKTIECRNGKCENKKCICNKCFSGELCDKLENPHAPKFKEHEYVATVSETAIIGSTVIRVEATDEDSVACSDKDTNKCPCSKVTYAITNGNKDGLFEVDQDTGDVITQRKIIDKTGEYTLEIIALNTKTGSSLNDLTKVLINIELNDEQVRARRSSEPVVEHHISRRAVVENPTASGVVIAEFYSEAGNQTVFENAETVPFNMTVYLNSTYTGTDPAPLVLTFKSTHLILDGNSLVATTTGGGTTSKTIKTDGTLQVSLDLLTSGRTLKIRFDGTVNASSPLNSLYVSSSVWNGQPSTGTIIHGPVASLPILYSVFPKATLERTSYEDLRVFSQTVFKMTMYIPKMTFPFIVEVSTSVNTFLFMTVSDVSKTTESNVISTGPAISYHSNSGDSNNHRAVLDFGNVEGQNVDIMQNKIAIEFKVTINDHLELKNNSKHWVGVGMRSDYSMLWVGQEAVYVIKELPTIQAVLTPVNDTKYYKYYAGDILQLNWLINHTDTSYDNAKSVSFDFYTEHLIITSIDGGTGTWTKVDDTKYTYDHGVNDLNLGSSISGTAVLQVPSTGVEPLMDLNVLVDLNYSSTSRAMDTRTFTPDTQYTYGVPAFSLGNAIPGQTSNISIGEFKSYRIEILLRRIITPLKIEVVVPLNQTAIMAIKELRLTHVGSNNQGVNSNAVPQYISSTNDSGIPDRAILDLGTVTNMQTNDLTTGQANKIILEYTVVMNDVTNVIDGDALWAGIGVKGGSKMMWVGQKKLKYLEKSPRRPHIIGVLNTSDISALKRGDSVSIDVVFKHENISSAHADSVKFLFMIPPYVVVNNDIQKSDTLNYKHTLTGPLFEVIGPFRFLDTYTVSFSVTMDPNSVMPATGKIYAFCPIQITYVRERTNELLASPFIKIQLTFTSGTVTPKPSIDEPLDPLPEFYKKGFLVDKPNTRVFVCLRSTGISKRSCYVSSDNGLIWNGLDPILSCIIGVDQEGKIYGISRNTHAYLRLNSHDSLATAITHEAWKAVSSVLVSKDPVKIPSDHLNTGDPTTEYVVSIGDGTKWGGNLNEVLYFDGSLWKPKACFSC